ncbi:MAG: motility associated factor glycosyltransferase family protein [Nitrospinaceae bacterium]
MDDFFQKNLTAFAPRHRGIELVSPAPGPGLVALSTPRGLPTARLQGRLLHSAQDPEREAAAFAKEVAPGARVFLYGFGLGYPVEAVLKRLGPQGSLLVLELNPLILAAAFSLRDLRHLAGDPRLYLIHGQQEAAVAEAVSTAMANLWQDRQDAPMQVLLHGASWQSFPEGFAGIATALEVLRMERRVPALFGGLESRNFTYNRPAAKRSPGLKTLLNRHRNRPGLLVSAGPSLDALRPYLAPLAAHCVTGCVDTALPVLRALDLCPDYVFTLDPQEESFQHFAGHLECPAPLVFTPTANPRVIRHYRGKKFVVFKEGHAVTGGRDELEAEKGLTQAGGSVACLGLDCLIQMGCNPMVLIGQDCAFSGGRRYARLPGPAGIAGASAPGDGGEDPTRGPSGEAKPVRVEGCHPGEVATDSVLYSYLRTLEQIAAANPQVRILNLQSQGARIAHTQTLGSIGEVWQFLGSGFTGKSPGRVLA